jgi:hypothetical protein
MESTYKLISLEGLKLACDKNFEEGDHVEKIEPLI